MSYNDFLIELLVNHPALYIKVICQTFNANYYANI